jgi:hypothetical protein
VEKEHLKSWVKEHLHQSPVSPTPKSTLSVSQEEDEEKLLAKETNQDEAIVKATKT